MKVQFYRKSVYGNEHMYLIDSDPARLILELIGQKTILDGQMRRFTTLGIEFEEVLAPKA